MLRKRLSKFKQRKIIYAVVCSIIAIILSFFILQADFSSLEAPIYDWQMSTQPFKKIHPDIATISINEETIKQLGRTPEVQDHIQFLQQMEKLNPKAIIYTINPLEIVGSYEELEKLAKVMERLPVIVSTNSMLPQIPGQPDSSKLLPPLHNIRTDVAPPTKDEHSFSKDSVTRRFPYSFFDKELLYSKIAKIIDPSFSHESIQPLLFTNKRSKQGYINFSKKGSFIKISFHEVMNSKGNLDKKLSNKVYFVGTDSRSDLQNYVRTPFSKDLTALSLIELHANIVNSLLQKSIIKKASRNIVSILVVLVSLLTVFAALSLHPTSGLILIIGNTSLFLLISLSSFFLFNLWIPSAQILVTVFICYYFFVPYRLIMEHRKSWEYLQRNKLLTQVEELKSNFMRMMSHDLKTPLARIQGMSDLILRDEKGLSSEQKNAVHTIKASAKELTKFIASILNLSRIESKEIKLQLQSRDINHLLEEIIYKCEYLAKEKNIHIVKELEPLFSLKIDESLLRQVFTNLIENAIKYSPEGKNIMVSSEEINGRISIQVADQGIGIPKNELDQVFQKFFRSSNVKNSAIKGSGLGLYLSNYFVSLHKGSMSVESEINIGSTFTVELPLDLS